MKIRKLKNRRNNRKKKEKIYKWRPNSVLLPLEEPYDIRIQTLNEEVTKYEIKLYSYLKECELGLVIGSIIVDQGDDIDLIETSDDSFILHWLIQNGYLLVDVEDKYKSDRDSKAVFRLNVRKIYKEADFMTKAFMGMLGSKHFMCNDPYSTDSKHTEWAVMAEETLCDIQKIKELEMY